MSLDEPGGHEGRRAGPAGPARKWARVQSELVTRLAQHRLWQWLTRTPFSARFTKYAMGSVVAFVSGNIAFMLFYVMAASTTVCSVAGFIAAAIPNWILNRRWAWQREGRPPARQVVGYIAISIVVLITTSAATGWTNARVQSLPNHHGIRLLIVTLAYVAVTVILFFAKFVVYEYWVFSERSRVRAAFRSLRQVPRIARANRMP
ncbi:MAG TPA: GtrA family protein [Solirubrobacteraceae bacterium]|jgi:putative flippase GtrA|nr:GtrA family protein [Solirubrobacteraceae bacterium]